MNEHKFLEFVVKQGHRSHAQLSQDLWALFKSSFDHGGYFVEFGAGDGKEYSNTYLLENECGWHGIVAEPNPVYLTALNQNRRCFISTKCVSDVSDEIVTFVQADEPVYSSVEKYALDDMHAEKRRCGKRISVPTQTLDDLLIAANAPQRIDYLSIDTEGSELDILSALNWKARDIRLISVEHNYTPRREAIFSLLQGNGYRRELSNISKWDDWYVKGT